MKITVIKKRVGEEPKVSVIENSLEAIQKFVGGYYEVIGIEAPNGKCYLHCNEDAIVENLPKNFAFVNIGGYIYGDIFFAQADNEGELISMSPENIDFLMSRFSQHGTVLKV